ncbi:MAG: 4-hydroxy-tetrahydrodipicolinate synthase [Pseudomonadota bacterium]
MFKGSMVALVTPMQENGEIDFKAFDRLIDWHIDAGTDALVIVGTTGESVTLTEDEQSKLIKHAVKKVNGKIPIIAGTGSNSTAKTIKMTEKVMHSGAHAALIVTPYYNKPTQEGLYQHYKKISATVPIPIIIYNVPSRTACDILPATIARLSHVPNIIGVKEATGSTERCREILALTQTKMHVYSGDDVTALDLMFAGAKGVISVTANIAPALMAKMCACLLNADFAQAISYNNQLRALHKAITMEVNPIPTKWALHKMGLISAGIRLPLLPLSQQYHAQMLEAMQAADIKI